MNRRDFFGRIAQSTLFSGLAFSQTAGMLGAADQVSGLRGVMPPIQSEVVNPPAILSPMKRAMKAVLDRKNKVIAPVYIDGFRLPPQTRARMFSRITLKRQKEKQTLFEKIFAD